MAAPDIHSIYAPASEDRDPGVARLLQLAAGLWLAYILLFLVIDRVFLPIESLSPWYYALNALNALLLFWLASWGWLQARLGRAFLPLVIGVMSVLPILTSHLLAPRFGPGPGGPPPGLDGPGPGGPGPTTSAEAMALRLLPVLLMALILTAWRYRRLHVVL